jgi:hypothetical protein
MPSSIAPGQFVLHSTAIPDLPAGRYTVRAAQSFTAPGATTTALDAQVEVTAPRFALPRDQILSTFPPNKSEGQFSDRLPQIVLKRRTLPWERELDGKAAPGALPRNIPWLALVLLADGEADFLIGRPIADCVTAGVVLEGANDVAIGDTIEVTQSVVDKVFPTKEDLPLLTHVRAVDLSDTELAMGDDDGWLSVVLCNRLPQPGVRYRACLVSLEGQYGALADTAPVEPEPAIALATAFVYPAGVVAAGLATTKGQSTGQSQSVSDAWSAKSATKSRPFKMKETIRRQHPVSAAHLGEMHRAGTLDLMATLEARYRFPVLANWQFTCNDTPGFQQLMQRLDVGLLDTVLLPRITAVGEKPPPPRTRPEPQVTDTGHVVLSHTTRAGERQAVWYRGPLVPHPGGRDPKDQAGQLPLLHSSDQARRIGPDGRENLSLAAAFEIGRLLALAEPSVVAAFLNWRKEGYERARRVEIAAIDIQLNRIDVQQVMDRFAARFGKMVIMDLGSKSGSRLGAPRPLVDGGCPINGIDGFDLVQMIATGFGLPVDVVRGRIDVNVARDAGLTVPVATQTIDLGKLGGATKELGHLRDAARATVGDIAFGALAPDRPGAKPDALDGLIRGRMP